MADYPNAALARVVRDLRTRRGATQEELGRDAGYGSGAGVSISRLESGLLRPGSERLAGIAAALGLTADELEARARAQAAEDAAAPTAPPGADAVGPAGTDAAKGPPGQKELNARKKAIDGELAERARAVTALSEEFNAQHDRARDEFFMRFVEIAGRVEGAPQPDPAALDDVTDPDPDAVADYRLRSTVTGVEQTLAVGAAGDEPGADSAPAADYGTFVAVVADRSATAGAARTGLSGVAATNARFALLGGGTMVLATIVLSPMAILAAGGLALLAARNRKQRLELAAQLDEAEAELAATRPGVEALVAALPRATEILDYIATHAGHALHRWDERLGSTTTSWDALGPAEQERYRDFIDVAAAQITVVTFNFQGLLTTRGRDRDELVQLADKILARSRDTVRAHV